MRLDDIVDMRPAVRRRIGAATSVAGLVLVAFVAVPFVNEFIDAERCLDAGGSYNYVDAACDRSRTHEFIPYIRRHPIAVPAAAVGLALAGIGSLIRFGGRGNNRRESD